MRGIPTRSPRKMGRCDMRIFDREYSAEKHYLAGTHRSRSPAQTVAAMRRHMPRMGITRLANVTGLDHVGIPVFVSVRPNSLSLATAQGKGVDVDSARASALMESVEGWHAEHIELPLRWDSYQRLRRQAPVVDVDRLALVNPVNHALARGWLEGWDLIGGCSTWVPYDVVTTDYVAGTRSEFLQTSNGLASGNHLLEAAVHGLCELIERDAEALWHANADLRAVDLTCIEEPYCAALLTRLRRAELFVAAWEMTSDLGIPAFGCLVMNTPEQNRWRVEGLHYGYGCHLEPAVALSRAISEAVQTRLTYIAGSRDDLRKSDYLGTRNPDHLREAYDELRAMAPNRRLSDMASLATRTFEGDLEVLLDAVRRAGLPQAILVDLGKPELEMAVVRMVVPDLMTCDAVLPMNRLPASRAAMGGV
ncbi:MAG: YcaO-like family protein [Myxococcales bacterium]